MLRVKRRFQSFVGGSLVLLSSLGGGVPLVGGEVAPLVVTSLADPGDGRCDAAECTLREAIAVAPPGTIITFDPVLFTTGPGTILLTSGALVLDKALMIQGPGQKRLQIDGQRLSRVLTITATGVVTLTRLTIQGGRCHQCNGGGIANKCPATDQRGVTRPQGRGCDIGAFELEVP